MKREEILYNLLLNDVIIASRRTSQKFALYSYYFMLSLKIDLIFCQKLVGIWNLFSQKTDKRIFYQELEKKNIGRLSA